MLLPAPLPGRWALDVSLPVPQERSAHAAAPARTSRSPGVGPQPSAQPAPRPGRPRVPELRRAVAAGHGAVCAGAGGAAAARATGGGGAGTHPAALPDRAVVPSAGRPGHAPRNPPRSEDRPARTLAEMSGDRRGRLAGAAAHLSTDAEGFGPAAEYLSGPGPWRQLARPGSLALLYPDPPATLLLWARTGPRVEPGGPEGERLLVRLQGLVWEGCQIPTVLVLKQALLLTNCVGLGNLLTLSKI